MVIGLTGDITYGEQVTQLKTNWYKPVRRLRAALGANPDYSSVDLQKRTTSGDTTMLTAETADAS
ncbi:hypothetical protein M514_24084 [Trichuris suis]|uniref:Uncharacterized protein n=1 Tax=Trichuris suis TaxID=68888 RepID=A0A085N2N5_9BILA|nr:hypothetical protein M514_24084 [Trichuris suis]